MKYKNFIITLFGVICILSGLSIFYSYSYLNNKMQEEIQKNIDENTIYVQNNENIDNLEVYEKNNESSLIELDSVIDELSSDQALEQVESYINVLEIPNLEIKAYINEGSDKSALANGVGHHENTAKIGESGNCVLAGHASVTYKCIFNRLEEIQLLDEFYLYDSDGNKHTYYVVDKFICDPGNTGILYNSGEGISTVTIYTCTNKGHQRFVVVGKEFNDVELERFRRELKDSYITNMTKMNDCIEVEPISEELTVRSYRKTREYNVSFFNKEVEKTNTNLYGVVLGLNVFDKEHEYSLDYKFDFGFEFKFYNGGLNNDISKN